jgi:hypothetical protein
MECNRFDGLTRTLSHASSSRRQALRALGSPLLGGAITRLGEDAAAKAQRHGKEKAHQKHPGQLRDAGKGHKKHKKKHHKKPKEPFCAIGEMTCRDIGGRCCPDGSCVQTDQCCPGQQRCADSSCIGDDECCPESTCSDGSCQTQDQPCCPDYKECAESCAPNGECCPEEKLCDDGSCASQDVCCPGERMCADGGCAKPGNCCAGERRCQDSTCISDDQCCPEAPVPICDPCEVSLCGSGELVCRATDACGLRCGDGYCPDGMYCYVFSDPGREGVCCENVTGHCTCASGYTGGTGCNGQCCKNGCSGTGCNP